ncbi:MAG TPA: ABC transporter permease [Candidatus Lachnoclostridium stercoripullorum]|uniref:ABC transporter permease n=1 Tax=Candidatus Lachnoclostridium stercoripullorum TaxID=2838635 RepID=A0A9D1W4A2_9FIRM|nr:ABC transporter permease [Candidatus Lachnoclostridium stercoripullorum]
MRFPDLLAMSVNNLRRRKLRTALTVLGVIVGTASIVVMMSLGIGMSEMQMELMESYGSMTAINVYCDTYSQPQGGTDPIYLTDEVVEQIRHMEHVDGISPLLSVGVMMRQGQYTASYVNLVGVTEDYMEQIPVGEGTYPKMDGSQVEMLFGNMVLQNFSNGRQGSSYYETGELPDVDLMGQPIFVIYDMDAYYQSMNGGTGADGTTPVKPPKKYMVPVSGIVAGGADDYNQYSWDVYTDLEALKTQLKQVFKKNPIPGQPTNRKGKPYNYFIYSNAVVYVDEIENVKEVQTAISDMGFQASSNSEWMEQNEKQSQMTQMVLGGIGAVSLFVAAIGIANTMMMSIYERTKEIGVMKVLGCDMGDIRNMFLMESGFIGLMGGVIGLALSYGISYLMNRLPAVSQMMMGMTGMEGNLSRIPLWLAGTAMVFAVVVGMAAGFFPAVRAMNLSPLAAIRNE